MQICQRLLARVLNGTLVVHQQPRLHTVEFLVSVQDQLEHVQFYRWTIFLTCVGKEINIRISFTSIKYKIGVQMLDREFLNCKVGLGASHCEEIFDNREIFGLLSQFDHVNF